MKKADINTAAKFYEFQEYLFWLAKLREEHPEIEDVDPVVPLIVPQGKNVREFVEKFVENLDPDVLQTITGDK